MPAFSFSRMKTIAVVLLLSLVIACAAIAGCASYSTPVPTTTQTAQPAVTSPGISITSPLNGATLSGTDIPLTVTVTNFRVVDKQGQAAAAGEGHVHFYLDVSPIPSDPAKPAIPANAQAVWAHVSGTSYTFTNVSPGMHTVSVQLVNNDHTPVTPIVTQSVMVTTAGGSATPAPTATVAVSGSGSGQTVTVSLVAQGFAFDKSTLTIPAGARVVMTFDNRDAGVPHNFALYTDSSAKQKIYGGALITGPATTTYTFTAPLTPGTYFFRCDVHPTSMYGSFVVTQAD